MNAQVLTGPLKNTQSNKWTFFSNYPMDWHKKVSPWLPKAFLTICPFKLFGESPKRG
jgi:hypothetical protein